VPPALRQLRLTFVMREKIAAPNQTIQSQPAISLVCLKQSVQTSLWPLMFIIQRPSKTPFNAAQWCWLPAPLFVGYACALKGERLCVVSPDPGGVKRAEMLREALEAALNQPVGKGFADKHRSGGTVSGDLFAGDVGGSTVLIIYDLVSTGGTLLRAAKAARKAGTARVIALAGAAEVICRFGNRSFRCHGCRFVLRARTEDTEP
jgi:Phosphoribosyl transferase domain